MDETKFVADQMRKKGLTEIEVDLARLMEKVKKDFGDLRIQVGCTVNVEKQIVIDEPQEMTLAELQTQVYMAAKQFGAEHDYFYQMFDCLKNSTVSYLMNMAEQNKRTKVELTSLINQLGVVISSIRRTK